MHLIPLFCGIVLVFVGIGLIASGKKDAELLGEGYNPNFGFALAAFAVAFFLVLFSVRVWGEDCWIYTPRGEGLSPECHEKMERR